MREEGIKGTFESHLGLVGSACDIANIFRKSVEQGFWQRIELEVGEYCVPQCFFSVWFFQDGNGYQIGS